jgi:cytochrome c-type biogenesis protein CcsB
MDSSVILGTTTFIYLLATVFYVAHAVFRNASVGKAGFATLCVAVLANSAGIGLRWLESHQQGIGYVPLSNMYESLVFFALCIASLYIYIELSQKTQHFGSYIVPFTFLVMAYASFSAEFGKEIRPLLPALQSNWLVAHVITCFIGYAAFAVSCGLAIFYLIKKGKGSDSTGSDDKEATSGALSILRAIDTINYKMIVFGFIWLTAGIVTGAIWANSAWGTYWSWDPKETWSLITWFVYALALHARYTRGWDGARMSVISLVGFISVIFTYYGVNFLLSGLHSYGG